MPIAAVLRPLSRGGQQLSGTEEGGFVLWRLFSFIWHRQGSLRRRLASAGCCVKEYCALPVNERAAREDSSCTHRNVTFSAVTT